jgi:hypothetical protein
MTVEAAHCLCVILKYVMSVSGTFPFRRNKFSNWIELVEFISVLHDGAGGHGKRFSAVFFTHCLYANKLRMRTEKNCIVFLCQTSCYCLQPTRGGPPALGLGEVLTTPHRKKL